MNTIELRLQPGSAPGYPVVQVLINGRDLLDRVRAVELPQATADGQPDLAGSYEGLAPHQWIELPERGEDGSAAVYRCGDCGELGCWPLRVRIVRRGGTVTWRDFQQPHRGWTYERLGPFTFREDEYDRAVAGVAKRAK